MQEYKEIISSQIIPQKWRNCFRFESLFKLSGNRTPQLLHSNNKVLVGKTFVRHNPINERWENCLQIFFLIHLLIILGKVTSQFLVLTILANEPFKGHSQWEHLGFTIVGIFNIYLQEECLNTVFVLCELLFVTKGEIFTDSILHGCRRVSKQEWKRRDGLWEILMAQ